MSLWPRLAGCELEARGGHRQPRFRQRFGLQSNERRQRPGYLAVSSRSLLGPRLQRATASQINGYVTTSNIQGSRSSLERRRWCFPVKDAYPGGVHIHYTIAQAVLRGLGVGRWRPCGLEMAIREPPHVHARPGRFGVLIQPGLPLRRTSTRVPPESQRNVPGAQRRPGRGGFRFRFAL